MMIQPILSPRQNEFWRNCTHRWNIKTGATRSGKTYMDYFLIMRRIKQFEKLSGLNVILGNTKETIRRNIILPMQEIYGARRVSDISSNNTCNMFGQLVYCLGADNVRHVNRIRGSSIKYCYGDEVTTWNQEVFDMLKSRLDKAYSIFDGTCNPEAPTHWFKKFLDSEADIYQQQYSIDDNPFLPQVVKDNLKLEYSGTVYYDRYIEGKWALAEGLIYPMWQKAMAEAPLTPVEQYCVSIDYGTENAFAAYLWELHNGVWYATREYYYSGRESGTAKTDDQYLRDIERFIADLIEPAIISVTNIMNGLNDDDKRIRIVIDPSAASFRVLLERQIWANVGKAKNDVGDGIRRTGMAINKGILKVSPTKCPRWYEEVQEYRFDPKKDDQPIKEKDHAMDSTRYHVSTNHIIDDQKEVNDVLGIA